MKKRARPAEPALSDELSSAIADAVRPSRLSDAKRKELRKRILERVGLEPPLRNRTGRVSETDWAELVARVRIKVLRRDVVRGDQTALVEMLPGAEFPPHHHKHEEEFFVLEGECFLDGYRLSPGDLHTSPPGSDHPRMTSPGGVLLLVRSEILGAAPAA